MHHALPLLTTFLIFAGVAGLLFFAAWALWVAPGRIRRAVSCRLGPRAIRSAVKTSVLYWLLVLALALLVAGLIAYLAWWYLGYWLYSGGGGWQDWLAALLFRTVWVVMLTAAGLDYERIVPVGIVLIAFLGVFAGAAAGTWLGIWVASRRFLITRAMF